MIAGSKRKKGADIVEYSEGLGLIPNAIIDQHFGAVELRERPPGGVGDHPVGAQLVHGGQQEALHDRSEAHHEQVVTGAQHLLDEQKVHRLRNAGQSQVLDDQAETVGTLVALGVLTLLSVAVDFWAAAVGAKRVGASRLAIIGAVVGTLFALFMGPLGLFVGPFLGAVAGEMLHRRKLDRAGVGHATRVGFGTWLGIVFGIALKLMLALAMLGLFAWSWWN